MTYIVISRNIAIIEHQEVDCRILYQGTYLECEKWKQEFIEEYEYVGSWGNTIKEL